MTTNRLNTPDQNANGNPARGHTTISDKAPINEVLAHLETTGAIRKTPYMMTALRYAAAGAETTVEIMTTEQFRLVTALVEDAVLAGLRVKGKDRSTSDKTIRNYVGALRRLREVLDELMGVRRMRTVGEMRRKRRFKLRPSTSHFPIHPEVKGALGEYFKIKVSGEDLASMELGRVVSEENVSWTPRTMKKAKGDLQKYARLAAANNGGQPVTLAELVHYRTFAEVQNWYRRTKHEEEEKLRAAGDDRDVFDGFTSMLSMASSLTQFARVYLRFFVPDLYAKYVSEGTDDYFKKVQGSLRKKAGTAVGTKPDVTELTSKHLIAFEKHFYDTFFMGPGTDAKRSGPRLRRTYMALVFLAEAPLRMENLLSLRIGTHLVFRDGVYHLVVPADELKNKGAGEPGVPYKAVLTPRLTAVIDKYRQSMEAIHGPDLFERHELFAAVSIKPELKVRRTDLGADIASAFMDTHGAEFTPHRARDIVASELIRWGFANGKDGFGLAAKALGDTVQTVIKSYYRKSSERIDEWRASLYFKE